MHAICKERYGDITATVDFIAGTITLRKDGEAHYYQGDLAIYERFNGNIRQFIMQHFQGK